MGVQVPLGLPFKLKARMVELVDAGDLKSPEKSCRFKSYYGHHQQIKEKMSLIHLTRTNRYHFYDVYVNPNEIVSIEARRPIQTKGIILSEDQNILTIIGLTNNRVVEVSETPDEILDLIISENPVVLND